MDRTALPSSATARWALAVALVLGVLGMHALVGPATETHAADHGAMVMGTSAQTHDTSTPADHSRAPAGGHSMLMTCLAVLGALAALTLLVAQAVRWPDAADTPRRPRSALHPVLGRSPPWTVPSLHQLSLLRV